MKKIEDVIMFHRHKSIEDKKCNECNNENENETLYWDNELDKPNMVDYTCLCEPCYNKINK